MNGFDRHCCHSQLRGVDRGALRSGRRLKGLSRIVACCSGRLTSSTSYGRLCPILLACWFSVCSVGCHSGQIYSPGQLPPEFLASQAHTAQRLNLTGFARSGTNSQQIIPGDLLQVAVATGLETDDQAAWPAVRVSDTGTIELPLVGTVAVAGLELDVAEQRIRDESMRRGIYRAPNVSVTLLSRRTNRVTVVGSVREPGVKELPASDCDLFAALVAAGGLADDASTVVEIRSSGHPTAQVSQVSYLATQRAATTDLRDRIDLAELQHTGGSTALDDGTVVMVMPQPARTVQVIGLVNTPSQIKMPTDQDMRLLDAVAQAGGLTLQVANKVHVIRHVPGRDEPVVIQTTIREAKLRAHANVVLAAGDVVSVEETATTFTVETLRSFIRFGFTSAIPGF